MGMAGNARVPRLRLERAWDAKLVKVNFGKLVDLARPMARYWWREVDKLQDQSARPAWVQLTYEQFKRRRAGVEPFQGVLELFGQTASLTWPVPHCGGDGGALWGAQHQPLVMLPSFLAR